MLLKMLVGLSGPETNLVAGDEREFDDAEAQRLVDAGFARALDTKAEAAARAVRDEAEAKAAAEAAAAEAAAAQAEAAAAEAAAAQAEPAPEPAEALVGKKKG